MSSKESVNDVKHITCMQSVLANHGNGQKRRHCINDIASSRSKYETIGLRIPELYKEKAPQLSVPTVSSAYR